VWVSVVAIPLLSIVVVFMVAVAEGIAAGVQIFIICAMFGISAFVFYLLDRISASHAARMETALYEREKEYYLEQCQMMQKSMEQERAARHDALTHFVALKGIADKNGDREAAGYLDGLLASAGPGDPHSDTGNVVFDSVINYKLRNANRDGVIPQIRLRRIPRDLNVDASDLAVVLGNLLDNALDAVARLAPGNRTIRLNAEFSRQALFIQVENPFDGTLKYCGKPGATTLATRKSGSDHGHGLRNIRRALEKYNGGMGEGVTINVKDGNIFSASVLLYVDGGDATGQS
jgi:sensor histidine kinase regulating citrate/malate metabolism